MCCLLLVWVKVLTAVFWINLVLIDYRNQDMFHEFENNVSVNPPYLYRQSLRSEKMTFIFYLIISFQIKFLNQNEALQYSK